MCYLFKLSEEVSLEGGFLGLLLRGETGELSASLRFDARPVEHLLSDAAEDNIQGAGQDASISIWT